MTHILIYLSRLGQSPTTRRLSASPLGTAALDSVEGVAQITGNDENVVLELLVDRKASVSARRRYDSGGFQAKSKNTISRRNLWVLFGCAIASDSDVHNKC